MRTDLQIEQNKIKLLSSDKTVSPVYLHGTRSIIVLPYFQRAREVAELRLVRADRNHWTRTPRRERFSRKSGENEINHSISARLITSVKFDNVLLFARVPRSTRVCNVHA